MATFYNNQLKSGETILGTAVSPTVPSGSAVNVTVAFLSAGDSGTNTTARVAFLDTTVALTTAALLTATFANTAGTSVSSGTGRIVFNRALSSVPAAVIMPDRTSFTFTLPSTTSTVTLTNNGYEAWSLEEVRLRNLGYF